MQDFYKTVLYFYLSKLSVMQHLKTKADVYEKYPEEKSILD